jgi:hypothetical protein
MSEVESRDKSEREMRERRGERERNKAPKHKELITLVRISF